MKRASCARWTIVMVAAFAVMACSDDDSGSSTASDGGSGSGGSGGSGNGGSSGSSGGQAGGGAAAGAGGTAGSGGAAGASGGSSAAYPNRPPGSWMLIGAFDGSIEEQNGHAFGIADFGDWNVDGDAPADQIEVVSDPVNPSGSGYALRFRFSQQYNPRSGQATAGTFSAGTQKELYVMIRLYLEPGGWDFGSKFSYFGADPAARGVGSPTQYYNDRPSGGDPAKLRLLTQNNGSVEIVDSADAPPKGSNTQPLKQGEWLSIEHHLVAESASGAGDGSARLWVNGVLVGSAQGSVAWNASGPPGFNGMQWYADTNTVSTESYYRVGELRIEGR